MAVVGKLAEPEGEEVRCWVACSWEKMVIVLEGWGCERADKQLIERLLIWSCGIGKHHAGSEFASILTWVCLLIVTKIACYWHGNTKPQITMP